MNWVQTRSGESTGGDSPSTSVRLWFRARSGDSGALALLFERLLPRLVRWTRGRLPRRARVTSDTSDLVQDAMMNAFRNLGGFEPRRRQALQAYLRQAIRNRVRDELRRSDRRPATDVDADQLPSPEDSPLEHAIQRENRLRYQHALALLDAEDQELIVGRVEMGFSYEQLALATGRASPDAARMAIRRALLRLAHALEARG